MDKTLKEMEEELEGKIRRVAALTERNRIMHELLKVEIPVGFWPLLNEIINPKEEVYGN